MHVAGILVTNPAVAPPIGVLIKTLKNSILARYGQEISTQIAGGTVLFGSESCAWGQTDLGDFVVTGYTTATSHALQRHVFDAQNAPEGRVLVTDSVGGLHSIFAVTPNGGLALRAKPACSGVFYGDAPGLSLACNRPLPVADLLQAEIDPSYLDWVIATGMPLDDTSPYRGIKSLLGDHALRLTPDRARLISYNLMGQGAKCRTDALTEERQADFERELLRASSAIRQFDRVELRLSGGKDSRLIAAALMRQGLSVDCHTQGANQDAEIAKQIAEIAGYPIDASIPGHSEATHQELEQTLLSNLAHCDGLIEYEAQVAMEPHQPMTDRHQGVIFGHSHLQKGGYARTMAGTDPAKAKEILLRNLLPNELQTRHHDRFRAPIEAYMNPDRYKAPIDMLYEPYAIYRCGRYLESLYLKISRFMVPMFPLNDERFYLACSRMNRHQRTREIACHQAIKSFAPALLDVPLCNDKWRFEPKPETPPPALSEAAFLQFWPTIPDSYYAHARLALAGSETLARAAELLDPGYLAQCGLGGAMAPDDAPSKLRLTRKTVLRLYLVHLLATKFRPNKDMEQRLQPHPALTANA